MCGTCIEISNCNGPFSAVSAPMIAIENANQQQHVSTHPIDRSKKRKRGERTFSFIPFSFTLYAEIERTFAKFTAI